MSAPTDDEIRDRLCAVLADVPGPYLPAEEADALLPTVRALMDRAEKRGAVRTLRETANHINADLPRFAASLRDRADRIEAS